MAALRRQLISEARLNLTGHRGTTDELTYSRNDDTVALWAGIDYSLRSPAISIYCIDDPQNYYTYFIPQLKREMELQFQLQSPLHTDIFFNFQALEKLPGKQQYTNRIERFQIIADRILECVERHRINHQYQYSHIHIGIEGYAPRVKNSNSLTGLCESGGILRSKIQQFGCTWCDIPPLAAKALFSNFGGSKKWAMMQAWRQRMKLPDVRIALGNRRIEELFVLEQEEAVWRRDHPNQYRNQDRNQNQDPPSGADQDADHNVDQQDDEIELDLQLQLTNQMNNVVPPAEDIVDSMAMLMCIHEPTYHRFPQLPVEKKPKKSRKKRKQR